MMDVMHSCRCCLRCPPDKDLTTPYRHLGKTEIYSDMLVECFDLQLIDSSDGSCGICSACVRRLRDASDFKLQVQRSQAELQARLQGALQVKEEEPAVEPEIEDGDGISEGSILGEEPPDKPEMADEDLTDQALESEMVDESETSDDEPMSRLQTINMEQYGAASSSQDFRSFYKEYTNYIGNISVDDLQIDDSIEPVPGRHIFKDSECSDPCADIVLTPDEAAFLENGCGCRNSCNKKFPRETIIKVRLEAKEIDVKCEKGENNLNLFAMGALHALTCRGPLTKQKEHAPKRRRRAHTQFQYQGIYVCKRFFQFVCAIGSKKLKNIKKKIEAGQIRSNNKIAADFSYEQRFDVISFIKHFSQQNSLVLPGRTAAHRQKIDLHFLPSGMDKKYVYDKYNEGSLTAGKNSVSLNSWDRLWDEYCSNIVVEKPHTDLCSTCQEHVVSLSKMQRLDEVSKRQLVQKTLNHLEVVRKESRYYTSVITGASEAFANRRLGPNQPCTVKGTMHYSFDFAQQVHLPHSPQQGPLYFLEGYKVGLFGVVAESLKQFVLYVIPEACSAGEGANIVISLLHHFFENFALGETDVICHADNCSSQNKNNFMLQYVTWRTLVGKHKSFQLSFLPAGHDKFAPDLYFGLFKQKFRMSESNVARDVCEAALSACAGSDAVTAVLVGNEVGNIINVRTLDWVNGFRTACPVSVSSSQISSFHHFKASSDLPGVLECGKTSDNSSTQSMTIFSTVDALRSSDAFAEIPCRGLSYERQLYLYENIRQFVDTDSKDILCPAPTKNLDIDGDPLQVPFIEVQTFETIEVTKTEEFLPAMLAPLKRKTPLCGYCGQKGHRNQKRNGVYFCKKRKMEQQANVATDPNIQQ